MTEREPTALHLGDAVSAWLDDELAPAARRETAAHLDACAACREEVELTREARMAVRALPVRYPPPDLLGALAPPLPFREPRRRVAWALAAAAAAIAALLLPRESSVTPVLPALVDSHAARASVTGDPLTQLAPIAVPVRFDR